MIIIRLRLLIICLKQNKKSERKSLEQIAWKSEERARFVVDAYLCIKGYDL